MFFLRIRITQFTQLHENAQVSDWSDKGKVDENRYEVHSLTIFRPLVQVEDLDRKVEDQVQEEGDEHPEEGEQRPVGLVHVPEVGKSQTVGDHVCKVDHAVHQQEEWTLPP